MRPPLIPKCQNGCYEYPTERVVRKLANYKLTRNGTNLVPITVYKTPKLTLACSCASLEEGAREGMGLALLPHLLAEGTRFCLTADDMRCGIGLGFYKPTGVISKGVFQLLFVLDLKVWIPVLTGICINRVRTNKALRPA